MIAASLNSEVNITIQYLQKTVVYNFRLHTNILTDWIIKFPKGPFLDFLFLHFQ